MKTFITVCITVVVVVGGYWGFRYWRAHKTPAADAKHLIVRLAPVLRGDLVEVVQAPGDVEARSRVSISAKVAARVVALPHPEGTTVTKGDARTSPSILVRLDATDLEAALRSARARYAAQEAQLKVSQARIASARSNLKSQEFLLADLDKELNRETNLFAKRTTSQQSFDQAKRRVDELMAQLDAAKHGIEADEASLSAGRHNLDAADAEIAKAIEDLSNATILSPIDGIVTRVNAKVGELVMTGTMNNAGTVILDVADLNTMQLVARVDEADIAAVKPGQTARVHMQAYQDRVFNGTVISVALASKDKDKEKNFTAEIMLDTNGERIPSGLTGDVDIETSRHLNVLKVPSQAVLGRPMDELPAAVRDALSAKEKEKAVATVVCIYKKGKSALVPVTAGASDATHTMIVSGLSESDRIVVGPYKILEKLKHDEVIKDEKETSGTKTSSDGSKKP